MDLQSPFRVLLSCGDLTVNVGGTLLRASGGHCNLVGVVSFPLILCSVTSALYSETASLPKKGEAAHPATSGEVR